MKTIEPIVLDKEDNTIHSGKARGFKVAYFGGVGFLPKLIFGAALVGVLALGLMFSSVVLVLFGIFFVVTTLKMLLRKLT